MKLALAFAASLVSSSALAHGGAHMHPHGLEGAWIAALVATVAVAALVAFRAIRK